MKYYLYCLFLGLMYHLLWECFKPQKNIILSPPLETGVFFLYSFLYFGYSILFIIYMFGIKNRYLMINVVFSIIFFMIIKCLLLF